MNPNVWLEDYRLACQVGRANDDLIVIQVLPIYLADSTRAWLDLRGIFTGSFRGMYVRPDNPWDLKGYWQKPGESLQDYIQHFSQKCHELPIVANADVI
jgi:hypothetical protein